MPVKKHIKAIAIAAIVNAPPAWVIALTVTGSILFMNQAPAEAQQPNPLGFITDNRTQEDMDKAKFLKAHSGHNMQLAAADNKTYIFQDDNSELERDGFINMPKKPKGKEIYDFQK